MKADALDPTNPPDFISAQVIDARRFYLDLAPAPTTGLTVVCGGWELCAPNYEMERSGFPFLSLEYLAEGNGELLLAGRQHPLQPGTLFTYGPEIPHHIRPNRGTRLRKYFVDFIGDRAEALLQDAGLPPGSCAQFADLRGFQNTFDDLIRHGQQGSAVSARICALLAEVLILQATGGGMATGASDTRARATYNRCREILNQRFLEFDDLQDIADACHVAPAYLCRLFTRFAGCSPYRLLIRLKMNRAAGLLQQPGRLVGETARELGYDDQFQFSRTFKRLHGISPKRYAQLQHRG